LAINPEPRDSSTRIPWSCPAVRFRTTLAGSHYCAAWAESQASTSPFGKPHTRTTPSPGTVFYACSGSPWIRTDRSTVWLTLAKARLDHLKA